MFERLIFSHVYFTTMQSVYIVYAIIILAVYLMYTNKQSESFEGDATDKKLCRTKAKKSVWSKYDWQVRIKGTDGTWKCPVGWEGTGCDWGMGTEFQEKQCRRLKSTRIETEGTNNTCASNLDCSEGRNCSYDGICYDKNGMRESSKGYCNRNSHCSTGRKCTRPGGKDDSGNTYKGTCQGTAFIYGTITGSAVKNLPSTDVSDEGGVISGS